MFPFTVTASGATTINSYSDDSSSYIHCLILYKTLFETLSCTYILLVLTTVLRSLNIYISPFTVM